MTDSLWGNIFKNRRRENESITATLARVPLFEGLQSKELAALERIVYERQYRSGETIFRQNDPAAGMYIIKSGTVEVVFEPTQQILAELSEGDFFGELALLDDSPRSATLRAQSSCELLAMFHADLFNLLDRNTRLGVKIAVRLAGVIGERLKRSNAQVQEMRKELYTLKNPPSEEADNEDG